MKSADEKEKLYLSLQRLTENTIEDIVNRSVNHKNMNTHNDLNINNKYKVLFVCLGHKKYVLPLTFIFINGQFELVL